MCVKAEIFSIGTELLMGELTDTNSAWMAARLPALGIELQGVSIIGDSLAMLTAGFARVLQCADLVLTTGGLGPTQDDLTREAIAAALQETPYLGIYSKADGIHLRMIARARDVATAHAMIKPIEEAIVTRLASYVWGYDDDTPEQAVGTLLTQRGLSLATMENCTGGYLVNSITPKCLTALPISKAGWWRIARRCAWPTV